MKSEKHTWSCIGTWDYVWLYALYMKVFYKYPRLIYYYDYNHHVRLSTVVELGTQLDPKVNPYYQVPSVSGHPPRGGEGSEVFSLYCSSVLRTLA